MRLVTSWSCECQFEYGCCNNVYYGTNEQFKLTEHLCPLCYLNKYPSTGQESLKAMYSKKTYHKYTTVFTLPALLAKTQKARGIQELSSTADGYRIRKTYLDIPETIFIVSEDQLTDKKNEIQEFFYMQEVFARPCPKLPRHGFLDSRQVFTFDEVRQLFYDMRKIDPESELILMPLIKATHNGVITNTVAAIGIGNDGATAGKEAISLPIHGELRTYKDSVSITESPYLETVYSKNNNYAVQLRNGPPLPRTKDIVPSTFTVDEIIDVDTFTPKEDLLAWEALCDSIKADRDKGKRQGIVIVHLNGPIGSHFCVHSVLRDIPFLTSHMPALGEVVEKVVKANPIDYRQVKKGIEAGLSDNYYKALVPLFRQHGTESHSPAYKGLVYLSLYALHGYTVAGKEESYLIGIGIANLIRVSVCAALGESRHHKGISHLQGNISRGRVYQKYFKDVFAGIKKLQVTEQIFLDGSWSDSYGGKNWASCTRATINLVNRAITFVKRPDEENFIKIMSQFNKLINEVHNGGKFLNKFTSNDKFDLAASDLALFVASNGSYLYDAIKFGESIHTEKHNGFSGMKLLRKMTNKDKLKLQQFTDAVEKYLINDESERDIIR